MITNNQLRALLLFFIWLFVSALQPNLIKCESTSPENFSFHCSKNGFPNHCETFVILHTNSYFSSLSNLSSFLGFNRFVLAQANGFPPDVEFLRKDRPLLIPIDCKCNGDVFEAELTTTTIKDESFYSIALSLEGLTTCKAITEKNPNLSPWNLGERVKLSVPLACNCPSSSQLNQGTSFLISYSVSEGDSISELALKFNINPETIISANNGSGEGKSPGTQLGFPGGINPQRRKSEMWNIGIYIALGGVVLGAVIAILAASALIQWKRKKQISGKMADVELQQLGLSIRTTSEKVSFDHGSRDTPDGPVIIDSTPRNLLVETYTIEELRKATEDFSSSNLIEGSVFHGRLNGKNVALKRTETETLAKIEFGLFQDASRHHPNIIRLIGTCLTEGPDSFLVFEYAKNGSLKDWLHGGLAMKSQFIASCYCFLNWNQRLKICLDVAMALEYMHQIMIPSYIHGNIKSRNIFLDEEFNAKVGNFGMPNSVEDDKEVKQSWNKGYIAPEYHHQGNLSPSIDVFAYGLVLLEVLSGKTPIIDEKGEGRVWLPEKIRSIVQSDNAEELMEWMDNALGEDYSFDGAVTLANLARACVEDDPSLRPSSGEIVEKLSRLVEELPQGEPFSICESSSKPLVRAAKS